jgi:hypothetical protein
MATIKHMHDLANRMPSANGPTAFQHQHSQTPRVCPVSPFEAPPAPVPQRQLKTSPCSLADTNHNDKLTHEDGPEPSLNAGRLRPAGPKNGQR